MIVQTGGICGAWVARNVLIWVRRLCELQEGVFQSAFQSCSPALPTAWRRQSPRFPRCT